MQKVQKFLAFFYLSHTYQNNKNINYILNKTNINKLNYI